MSSEIKAYHFENLPKLSKKDIDLQKALLRFFPHSLEKNPILTSLSEYFLTQFGQNLEMKCDRIEEATLSQFVASLPENSMLLRSGVKPLTQPAFVWVDQVFLSHLVDRLLGGKGDLNFELKNPTPIEQTVVQYLFLKIFNIIKKSTEKSPLHFTWESLLYGKSSLAEMSASKEKVILIYFSFQMGEKKGFAVLCFPHPFIEAFFLQPDSPSQGFSDSSFLSDELGHFLSQFKTDLWAEIGSVTLTISEKNNLEKGDVILFDQTECHLASKQLSGYVVLKVGEGKMGGFLAQVVSSESPALVKILNYHGGC